MAHNIKIAGASYADVSIVRLTDTAGEKCDYASVDDIFAGGITIATAMVTDDDLILETASGDPLDATKAF